MGSTAERLRKARWMAGVKPSLLTATRWCFGVVALVPGIGDDPFEHSPDGALDAGEDGCKRVPVIRTAGERLHVGHKLAAPTAVEGCRHADFDAELIGFVGLAFANAFNLGSVQRAELAVTLALTLILDPASTRERQREQLREFRAADDPTGVELLFEVFSQRYERGSAIVTSNLPFEDWTSVLGSERLTGALLDRLTHHVSILTMNATAIA